MPQKKQTTQSFSKVITDEITVTKSTVTQLFSTAGCTLSSPSGVLTTISLTTPTSGSTSVVVSSSDISADSVVLANLVSYSGNGLPNVHVTGITQGSCTFVIQNHHDTAPLNAVAKIGYLVV